MTDSQHNIDIPSGRIRFALEAMKEFESRDGCQIHMHWWRRINNGTCFACCGGAARIKRDGLNPSHDNGIQWSESALSANAFEFSLNSARVGWVGDMFDNMDFFFEEGVHFDRDICDYASDADQFYADMNKLADDLEAGGY